MGVLLVLDEPEETILDIRLANAKRDAKELETTLRRAYNAACEYEPATAPLLAQDLRAAEELAQQIGLLVIARRNDDRFKRAIREGV